MSPTVRGRGLKRPHTTVTVTPLGVVLRIDDDADPELWYDVVLSADDLRELLAEVEAERLAHDATP